MEWITHEEYLRGDGLIIENAIVKKVSLNFKDHGALTLEITVRGRAWECNFGGYALGYGSLGADKFSENCKGLEAIMHIMDTVGVAALEDMNGRVIRVAHKPTGSWRIEWIGNVIDDKWFSYKDFFGDDNGR